MFKVLYSNNPAPYVEEGTTIAEETSRRTGKRAEEGFDWMWSGRRRKEASGLVEGVSGRRMQAGEQAVGGGGRRQTDERRRRQAAEKTNRRTSGWRRLMGIRRR